MWTKHRVSEVCDSNHLQASADAKRARRAATGSKKEFK